MEYLEIHVKYLDEKIQIRENWAKKLSVMTDHRY